MGVLNLEEDERLNLGGVVEHRTSISLLKPFPSSILVYAWIRGHAN